MKTAFIFLSLTLFLVTDLMAQTPVIGVAKDEVHVGRQVTFTFYLENFGDVDLVNLDLADDLDAVFGAGNYFIVSAPFMIDNPLTITPNPAFDGSSDTALISSGSLAVGTTASIGVVIEITAVVDQGLGLGTYSNQVTAMADGTVGGPTSDISDFGMDPDPNGNDDPTDADEGDPTIVAILENPRIGVSKSAFISGNQVTLDFFLETFGNVDLSNLSLVDDLDATFGTGNYMVLSGPTLIDDPGTISVNGGFDGSADTQIISSGSLMLGDTAQIRVTVDVTNVVDLGLGLGVYNNQATATGEAPGGATGMDTSDEGVDPDPDGDGNPSGLNEDDPTVIVIGEEPVIGLAKDASVTNSIVTVDLYLENLGNITLDNLSLTDDLNAAFGMGNYFVSTAPVFIDDPGTITLNAGYDGNFDTQLLDSSSTLAAGDTAQIRMEISVAQLVDLGSGLGVYANQAFASGQAPSGGLTQDASDDGTDPDPNGNGDPADVGEDDATPITVPEVSLIGIAKEFVITGVIGGDPVVALEFTITNYGNQRVSNLSVSDDLNAVYGAGNFIHSLDPVYVEGATTLNYNPAFNGGSNTALLNGGSFLDPLDSVTFRVASRVVTIVDQGFGLGIYQNQVTVIGTDPSVSPVSDLSQEGDNPDPDGNGNPSEMDPTVIDVSEISAIGIAKDVSVAVNQITFDFYLENLGTSTLEDLNFREDLDTLFGEGNFTIQSGPSFVDDPGTITFNSAFNGSDEAEVLEIASSSLAPGDTAQIRLVVSVDVVANVGLGLGNYSNQVTLNGFSTFGTPVTDSSDFGTDPDPNGNGNANEAGENDATTFSLSVDSPIGVAKDAAISGNRVTLDLYLENHGVNTLSSVSLIENLDDAFGAGNYTIFSAPALIVDPGTLILNGAFDGSGDSEILAAGSTLASGALAQITLIVDVDIESDQGSGFGVYSNQATAFGTQPNGVILRDLSDDGTDPDPNGNNDPGDAGEDDPTSIVISVNPVIGISKKAYVNGSLVIFDFYIENLGEATLTNVFLQDPLNPVFGSNNYSVTSQASLVSGPGTLLFSTQFFGFSVFDFLVVGGSLRPGEVSHFRTTINVNTVADVGNGFGIYLNGVTVSATAPDGSAVMDDSDDGIDPDPNGNGNPGDAGEGDDTQIVIGDEARMGVAKTASVTGSQVTLDFFIENFGASTLASLSLLEDLDTVFGAGNYSLNGVPTLIDNPGTITINPGFDGSADPELMGGGSTLMGVDTASIRVVVDVSTVADQGLGLGNYTNQVSISGIAPVGSTVFDLSDNGTDPDPNGDGLPFSGDEDDPTTFSVGFSSVGAAKNATVNGRQVILDYYVANLGDTTLTSLSLPDDLDAVFGAGNYTIVSGPTLESAPRDLDVNTNFDGSSDTELIGSGTIGLGVTEQIRVVVEVLALIDGGSGLGVYSNQVTATAGGLSDLSDSGTDPDPNGNGLSDDAGEDDPTVFTIAEDPVIGAAKTVSVTGRAVTINLYLESFSNVNLSNVSLVEDLNALLGAGNFTITSAPVFIDDPGTLNLNGFFDGGTDTDILAVGSTLAIGDTAQIRLVVTVDNVTDQGLGLGMYDNQVTASAQSPGGTPTSDLSDDGTDPDPNGNDDPTEAGEDDASPIELRGSIGDFVWNDLDGDGVQDGGEPGLSGVTVFLDSNTNGTLDGGEPSTVTDGTGFYSFTDLAAGTYTVVVDGTTITTGFNLTTGNQPLAVTLFSGEDDDTADFGYQQQDASIGDFVWSDLDGDGVQDGGEPGISGVTVFLDLNTNGALDGGEPSDTTDGSGAYDITDLATGTYSVNVDASTVTAGFVLTGGTLPQSVTIVAGEDFNDADFGYQQQDASIGDFVWNDLDGDGVQDGGEPGISGVTVFLDLNSNGALDGGEPSDTTDGAGAYDITDLATGTYSVDIDASTVTAGFVLTGGTLPQSVSIAAGEDFNDADFGYQQQDASIGDFVWNDLDGDGVQDGGEPGISGVTVFLDLNSNGSLDGGEPSDVTDGSGAYDFTNLATGTYDVTIDATTLPAGFVLTGGTVPQSVNLAAGEDFNDADFGYQQQNASIGDFVWNDLDGDGVQDGGEPGISGVTVFLDLNSNGSLDGGEPSAVTDGAGAYDFTGLPTGTYSVEIDATTIPAGFVLTGGTVPQTVNLTAGEDFNDADFGYQQQDASIGDFVWNDLNGDGVQDGGEPGIAGVTVFLDLNSNGALDGGEPSDTTDGAGAYDITNLATGTYSVDIDASTVTAGFVLTGGVLPQSVTIAAGEDFNDADFGYQQQDASIGDFVWNDLDGDGVQDAGEPGISGVTVYLDLNSNGALDGGEPSATTDGAGAYDITSLATGTYSVNIDPATLTASFVLTGGTLPQSVSIAAGEDFNDADFGFQQQDASIGDFVWNDLDGDGVQDGGEPGISGVTVFLDLNTNGALDGGEPSAVTDGSGAYDFTNLATGTYSVNIDPATVTMGFVLTGGTVPQSVSIAAGEDFNDADFGYQQQDATIGDFVWNDLNGDGVQDGGEPGIAGVTVYLDLNTNGAIDGGEPTAVTDGAGAYDFTDLATGTYSVNIDPATVTTGFVLTGGTLPQSVNLAAGEDFNDADFGYQQQDATIGDFVWNDLNGDGVQDGGEPGTAGVTVYLDLNTNGALDAGEPSATTDAAGAYDITDLATGTYSVNIDPTTVPAGFVLTGGTLPQSVTIAAGEDFNDADFGYQQQDASIGDFVWNDLNGDGIQDGGEPGLSGITVYLDLNTNGAIDGGEPSEVTGAAGDYDFTGLATGTYSVNIDPATVTSGFVLTGGALPQSVNLAAGEDFNDADFGYQQQDATIGDFVWNDLDGDGVQDGGEPGIAGVTVYLDLNTNDALDAGEPSQVTGAAGDYDFTDLATGTYTVNIDPATVTTGFVLTGGTLPQSVNLAAGEDFNDADFGYQQQDASIGDFVWNDLNGDGVQDGGESGIAGVTVYLDLDSNGAIDGGEPTAVTDGAGAYDFTDLATGTYSVNIDPATVTAGFVLTGGTLPQSVTIAAGEDFNDADFGYQQQDATIGDFVWNDLNGDGVQDAGEPGLAGVTLDLIDDLNGNGAIDAGEPVRDTQTTDASGIYDFTGLPLGDYLVNVTDANTALTGDVLTGGTNPFAVTITAGQDFNDADFGYQRQDGFIGDLVWHDFNGDGVLDAGEPGLANVTLDLIEDTNGNGVIDAGEPVLDTQTTDADGMYTFPALAVGDYIVEVTDTNSALDGFQQTGNTNPVAVSLIKGGVRQDIDFAFLDVRAEIGVSLSVTVTTIADLQTRADPNNQFLLDFTFRVENFGSVTLFDLSMTDDLNAVFFNTVFQLNEPLTLAGGNSTNVAVNSAYNGSTQIEMFAPNSSLAAGEFVLLHFQVFLSDPPVQGTSFITYENQVRVNAVGASGNPVFDDSEQGLDPDADGNGDPGDNNDPTVITLPFSIPTLGEWGLIFFLVLLAATAMWYGRRQRLST